MTRIHFEDQCVFCDKNHLGPCESIVGTAPLQCTDCQTFVSVENASDDDALYGEPAGTTEVALCAECLAQRHEDI